MTTTTTTSARAVARTPEQVHALLAAYATAGDVQGMTSLYEPDALLLTGPASSASGAEQLRSACADLCRLGVRFTVRTDAAHVSGDLTLLSTTWTATSAGGDVDGGRATHVVRRQPDGRWLAVIDDLSWIAS